MVVYVMVSTAADMVRYHVSVTSVETLSRFCGAMSKKVFPSVSGLGYGVTGNGVWGHEK